MTITHTLSLIATALIGVLVAATTQAQTVDTRSGKLEFELGVPTKETVTKLYDEMDYQRACQLFLWSFPIVALANLQVNLEGTTGARPGDLTIYMGNKQSKASSSRCDHSLLASELDLVEDRAGRNGNHFRRHFGVSPVYWQRPRDDLVSLARTRARAVIMFLSGRGRKLRPWT